MPVIVMFTAGAMKGNSFYVLGGTAPALTALTTAYKYDTTAGTWSAGAPLNHPLRCATLFGIGGDIFIMM